MAQKPDGRSAKVDRVTFTRPAAERIAKVVRTVERGDTSGQPLTFGSGPRGLPGVVFRVCTFTGAWSINASKTVTFKYQTATPNTASAINLFSAIASFTGSRDCAIAKEGTAWFLVAARCP